MPKSKTFKEAEEYLNNKPLSGEMDCNNFSGITKVNHWDGTTLLFTHTIIEDTEQFLYVWTEHNGFHVWNKEDIIDFEHKQWKTDKRDTLWTTVDDFIFDNEIRTEKDISEALNSAPRKKYQFIKNLCEIVGYHKDDDIKEI